MLARRRNKTTKATKSRNSNNGNSNNGNDNVATLHTSQMTGNGRGERCGSKGVPNSPLSYSPSVCVSLTQAESASGAHTTWNWLHAQFCPALCSAMAVPEHGRSNCCPHLHVYWFFYMNTTTYVSVFVYVCVCVCVEHILLYVPAVDSALAASDCCFLSLCLLLAARPLYAIISTNLNLSEIINNSFSD